jgi:very-short-patch-repair endonuclease
MESPLHRFAAEHEGVVTVADARLLGYDWSQLRTILREEGWVRVAPSAYALPDRAADLTTRVRAEQLRHPVVASHRTAALLHGSDVLTTGFDFTVDGSGRYDVPDGVLYRWALAPGDVVTANGIVLTSAARTATDLLRALPRDDAVIAVDGLLRAGAVTLDVIADRLDQLHGRSHIRRARTAFPLLDPRSGSVAETKARLVLHDARLWPRSQVVLVDEAGRRIRVDFWFPAGVAVEVEGYAFHSTREQHQADVARFNELARVSGTQVLRFSWADVFHRPRAVVATVRAALATATGERRLGASVVR